MTQPAEFVTGAFHGSPGGGGAEYIVFEHSAFDYEQENHSVEEKIEKAMANFDYNNSGYCIDTSKGRIMYFYYNPEQYFKYIRPVRKINKQN